MNNRITRLFQEKSGDILSIYLTAGYPRLEDTAPLIRHLADAGVDMIEIGIPFSDPVADGPTIQQSNQQALENGISLSLIFDQLKDIRESVDIPLLLMGYINPVLQFGVEKFCHKAAEIGIDGVILPDLPLDEYLENYRSLFESCNLSNILLITPQTSEARIRRIDAETKGFIYVVSTDSTTGKTDGFGPAQLTYFERITAMKLQNPTLVGFGISGPESFRKAADYNAGAIIGSAFIKAISSGADENVIRSFIHKIRTGTDSKIFSSSF
ncbi:MAG: tryptophan synthase subunit alpha [Bacteroidia bacterium]|nr:tryptophan synthase subunit alpha [Bacteroidia bacterium]